jgi:Mg2+ and Co2+ transporter CorA
MKPINLQKQIDFISKEVVYNSLEINGIKDFVSRYRKQHKKHASTLPRKDRKKYLIEVNYHVSCDLKRIEHYRKQVNTYNSILNSLKQLEANGKKKK